MSEIVVTGPRAPGPAASAAHGALRNPGSGAGNAFASLLLGLGAAEPLASDSELIPDPTSENLLDAGKEGDPVAADASSLAAMLGPDLMLMQRAVVQAGGSTAAAAPAPLDPGKASAVAPPEWAPVEGGRAGQTPVANTGVTAARLRQVDGAPIPRTDGAGLPQSVDGTNLMRGEAKARPAEAQVLSAPGAPQSGRVDPAHLRDLPPPDFRLAMRSLPPEPEAVAIPAADMPGLGLQRSQQRDGSAPEDGRGREGSGTAWTADRQTSVDEAVPVAGVLPEDYAAAAQSATDGMAYWSTNGVHTGEIQLQDGLQEPMNIRVRVSGDEAQVAFAADHAALREQLASTADQLQALLGDSGIRLTDVSVGTSGRQPQPQPQPETGTRPKDSAVRGAVLEPLVALQPTTPRRPAGRLDIFA